MNRPLVLAIVAVAALAVRPVAAQSESEVAAYSALLGTPMGALPPLLTSTMIGVPLRSAQLACATDTRPAVPTSPRSTT